MLEANKPGQARLTNAQQQCLRQAYLEFLDRTGVRLFEEEAIELLRKAGARVSDGNRVRIPPRLVEWAISTAPKRVVLYDRKGEPIVEVEGYRSYFGPGSDCPWIVDHRTSKRRVAVLSDVIDGISVCDALEQVDFVMSMFLPSDVRQAIADRYQMEVMLNFTDKPVSFVSYELAGCRDAVEMAEIVAGGKEALSAKPFIACFINPTSGMRHNKEALQKLLFMAERGLPSFYVPGDVAGVASPVTVAGGNVLRVGGALVGLTLAQLKREGAPVFLSGWGALAMDMRTMVMSYCGPEHQGVPQQMVHSYDLPIFGMGGVSDAKLVDQQAGIEAALTIFTSAQAGSHIVHDLGYLESGLSGSLAQLVICDEIIAWIKRSLAPVEVSDETMALDVIDDVGPDGQFLGTEHTLRHFRDLWYPRLFERGNYETWEAKGCTTLGDRAVARVDELLATYQPRSLPPDVKLAIQSVVLRAESQ